MKNAWQVCSENKEQQSGRGGKHLTGFTDKERTPGDGGKDLKIIAEAAQPVDVTRSQAIAIG